MKIFKGLLKYSAYLFIAAWMFLLGIMVGRGNSPVEFDTQKFQKRLETIAQDFGAQKKSPGKIDLKFYDVLDNPELEEGEAVNNQSKTSYKYASNNKLNKNRQLNENKMGEILPRKNVLKKKPIPLKISKKKETFQKGKVEAAKNMLAGNKSKDVIKKKVVDNPYKKKSEKKPNQKPTKKSTKKLAQSKPVPNSALKPELHILKGKYTIQIAAYTRFKDAVSQMAILKKKGFASYRVKLIKDGVTFYRVRSGSFANFEQAKKFKQKLEKNKIESNIIPLG